MKTLGNRLLAWKQCKRCPLSKTRHKVVLYRGSIPCDILFIGEAPGKSENASGKPFVGPSGKLLGEMVREAQEELKDIRMGDGFEFTYGITNIVACIPWNNSEDGQRKGVRPPTKEEVEACEPRLALTIKKVQPKAIILLGKTSEAYADDLPANIPILKLQHPAYVIRHGTGPSEPRSRFVTYLRDFLDTLDLS